MQIFARVTWGEGVKWECGRWKWRFALLSVTVFWTFYIHGHTTAFTWYDCQWPWPYFKVIRLFHIKFLKNSAWYGKSYYRLLIGSHTLAFDWCHFWWPWSICAGHFSTVCHFHVHFSNLWQAFASRGLPAIAELLVHETLQRKGTQWTVAGRKVSDWLPCIIGPTYTQYCSCAGNANACI